MAHNLDNYIEGVKDLPVIPAVMTKLIGMFQQPDRDLDDIVNLMRKDPTLTAEVLRHSNSAYFGQQEPIVDIFEAITCIGFYEAYKTVVTKLGKQAMQAPAGGSVINVQNFFYHSMLTATTSGAVARYLDESESLAFTAGLLHDIGKIVLALGEGPKYSRLIKFMGDSGEALARAEAELLGFGHPEIGARLLAHWGLPDEICTPVLYHHEINPTEPLKKMAATVRLGNIGAHSFISPTPEKLLGSPAAIFALEVIGLGPDEFASILQDAQKDIKKMEGLSMR